MTTFVEDGACSEVDRNDSFAQFCKETCMRRVYTNTGCCFEKNANRQLDPDYSVVVTSNADPTKSYEFNKYTISRGLWFNNKNFDFVLPGGEIPWNLKMRMEIQNCHLKPKSNCHQKPKSHLTIFCQHVMDMSQRPHFKSWTLQLYLVTVPINAIYGSSSHLPLRFNLIPKKAASIYGGIGFMIVTLFAVSAFAQYRGNGVSSVLSLVPLSVAGRGVEPADHKEGIVAETPLIQV